jgi:uncharacterized membrane protein
MPLPAPTRPEDHTVRRLLWILLAVFTAVLFVLVIRHSDPIDRLSEEYDLSTATIRAVMVIVVGAMVFVLFRQSFTRALEAALLWVVIALLLAFTLIGIPVTIVLMLGVGVWVLYRLVRGWSALAGERPVSL